MSSELKTSSLGVDFPAAQARLRSILRRAQEIGPAGRFLCLTVEDCLRRADVAAAEQDTVAMIALYQEMMEIKE